MPASQRVIEMNYEKAAAKYLYSLTLENHMEGVSQAKQRKIFLVGMDIVRRKRPNLWIFNELLIQYKLPRRRKLGQVVPDNFVSITDQEIRASTSYNVPLEPVGPFWTLEYVSNSNKRKDYEDSFVKYERELKVPYYLIFYPDNEEMTLYRHNGTKYVTVLPNANERYAILELDIEVALLDGWVRFWFEGELLPLTDELMDELDKVRQERDTLRNERDAAREDAAEAHREIARLKALLEQGKK